MFWYDRWSAITAGTKDDDDARFQRGRHCGRKPRLRRAARRAALGRHRRQAHPSPVSGYRRHEVWPTPDFPTSIGLRSDGGAIVGLRDRVTLWGYGEEFRTLAVVEPDLPDNRLNEGRVGPDGAFWVGTMQDSLNPDGSPKEIARSSGAIFRVERGGHVSRLTPREFGIANAWTADGRFLTADTIRNEIYAYDVRDGALSNKRVFAPPLPRGAPDGSCLDDEGRLWNCRVAGGACVACFRPEGALDRLVELPCAWPTSCAFGGPDFATLYVTSALHHDSGAYRRPSRGRSALRGRRRRARATRTSLLVRPFWRGLKRGAQLRQWNEQGFPRRQARPAQGVISSLRPTPAAPPSRDPRARARRPKVDGSEASRGRSGR